MTEEIDGGGGSVNCDTGIGDMLNVKTLNGGNTTAARAIPARKTDAGLTNSSSKANSNINNKIEQKHHHIKNLKTQSIAATSSTSTAASDSEEGFLSTSPDSANGEAIQSRNRDQNSTTTKTKPNDSSNNQNDSPVKPAPPPLFLCLNPQGCVTLRNILDCFKAPISEEQAWALLFQFVSLYHKLSTMCRHHVFNDLEIPETIDNVNVHRDGTVHCSWSEVEFKEREQKVNAQREQQQKQQTEHHEENEDDDDQGDHHSEEHGEENHSMLVASHKKVLRQLAVIVYTALDFNLQADEQCQMSQELEDVFNYMTADDSDDDCIDEGIDEGYKRWDDENDYEKFVETKEFDFVLEACKNHIKPTVPEDHYKAVCRALVTETLELRVFLQQVLASGANNVHLKAAESQTSQQELAKLGFNDWARFWVQVIDEMRRGYRLKTINHSRAPLEFELTPYEILMEDIRCKKYRLRKVMVNGDIPPRVKKDAHAIIMDFIRSRPPLKKASERKLPPPIKRQPSPREQLMDSIRQGQTLKHVQPPTPMRLKDRLLPSAAAATQTAAAPSSTPSLLSTTEQQTTTSSSSAAMANMSGSAQTLHDSLRLQQQMDMQTMPRSSKQRLIKVDFSLLQDEDSFFDNEPPLCTTSPKTAAALQQASTRCSLPKMPPYPIGGYMISEPPAQATTITKSMGQQQQHQQVMTAAQYQYQQHQQQQTQQGMPLAGLTQRVLRRTSI